MRQRPGISGAFPDEATRPDTVPVARQKAMNQSGRRSYRTEWTTAHHSPIRISSPPSAPSLRPRGRDGGSDGRQLCLPCDT